MSTLDPDDTALAPPSPSLVRFPNGFTNCAASSLLFNLIHTPEKESGQIFRVGIKVYRNKLKITFVFIKTSNRFSIKRD